MQQIVLAPAGLIPGDSPEEIQRDIRTIGAFESIPTLLDVLCRMTGMGFAAVARVTDNTWTACAVKDDINFGLQPGGQLEVGTTLCIESKRALEPIVIERASTDERYCAHHTPRMYKIESYISVPIVLDGGRYFGNLCAIDPAPAKLADGRILHMFESFASLIGQHLDNEARRETAEGALRDEQAASELREQFIAILGHDLRNPLQAVAAAGEFLERRSADPVLKGMAGRIRTNVKRMSALIDDVLDFARARLGGGIGLQVDTVEDFGAGLSAVVKELQDGHPQRQILCEVSVSRPVCCDLGRVQQVVSNLIANALSHGAAASPVKVRMNTDPLHLVIDVWNAGEPIPAESMGRIFEPFWRHSTAAHRQGLGLGLHICSQIVRAHGGTLSVSSTADAGTNFIVRLPLESQRAS